MLISPMYKEMNRELHENKDRYILFQGKDYGAYGTSGYKWAHVVEKTCSYHKLTTVLDYGCGKGLLSAFLQAKGVPLRVTNYDPAIPKWDEIPTERFDLVVCADVLEHIEPDCIDEVLDHIESVTGTLALLVISTKEAKKTLPDGRNAHLIVKKPRWWKRKLKKRFRLIGAEEDLTNKDEIVVWATRKNRRYVLPTEGGADSPTGQA